MIYEESVRARLPDPLDEPVLSSNAVTCKMDVILEDDLSCALSIELCFCSPVAIRVTPPTDVGRRDEVRGVQSRTLIL